MFTSVNFGKLSLMTLNIFLLGDNFLHELAPAGTYPVGIKLKAVPDPDCDPTQGFCEEWLPGNYTVKIGKYRRSLYLRQFAFIIKETKVTLF